MMNKYKLLQYSRLFELIEFWTCPMFFSMIKLSQEVNEIRSNFVEFIYQRETIK